ncbi:MAG TPA: SET domain-containing protein-lysine N-methyltransferase [Steroidobacteraceae bacterium]|nr:SET domain-containing protein-lysine N-methyltransferase [Steroidobacteraceae bacterium]
MSSPSATPPYRVRRSKIHGTGVFATRRIARGERIVEYLGERVTHAEADRRYAGKADDDNHTFLFTVDARTVIDAGVGGNAARYINHSCAPNCETVLEDRRVFIEAIEDIEAGAELCYDYMIERDADDPPNIDQVFGCRCGASGCRGTMLLPPPAPRRPARRGDRAGRAAHRRA